MLPVILGIGAAALALLASAGERTPDPAGGGKPPAKKARRVMSSQEAFEAGKVAERAERDAFDRKVASAVKRQSKPDAAPPAARPEIETPDSEPEVAP